MPSTVDENVVSSPLVRPVSVPASLSPALTAATSPYVAVKPFVPIVRAADVTLAVSANFFDVAFPSNW